MPILTNSEFRKTVFDFIEKYQMTATTFGKMANNDTRFVYDLKKNKRKFGERIILKVISFMDKYDSEGKKG